jgi:hypothetical protein
MSDDTELSPQSDDETEAVLTEAAYAGPVAWSDSTSSQPVVDYVEPRWRGLLPKLLAPAAAVAIGAIGAIAVMLWMPDRHQAPAPKTTTPSAAPPPTTPQAAPRPTTSPAAPAPPPAPQAAPDSGFCPWSSQCNFLSPSRNISCEIDYRFHGAPDAVFCYSITPPQSVTMYPGGAFTPCPGENCLANAAQGTPTLEYGQKIGLGPFSCLSETSGVTCSVASGRGFSISSAGITPVG